MSLPLVISLTCNIFLEILSFFIVVDGTGPSLADRISSMKKGVQKDQEKDEYSFFYIYSYHPILHYVKKS